MCHTQAKKKRVIAKLILYGALCYLVVGSFFLLCYLPNSWIVRLFLSILFTFVPFIIYWVKKKVFINFEYKLILKREEYKQLQLQKAVLIEDIMQSEAYNTVKSILQAYAPEKLEDQVQKKLIPANRSSASVSTTELRQRTTACRTTSTTTLANPETAQILTPDYQRFTLDGDQVFPNPGGPPKIPMAYPIFANARGIKERLIEFIVGDGPNYRFALICKFCKGHNGMALKHDYWYSSYTCCYCLGLNPAKSVSANENSLLKLSPLPPSKSTLTNGTLKSTKTERVYELPKYEYPLPEPAPVQKEVKLGVVTHQPSRYNKIEWRNPRLDMSPSEKKVPVKKIIKKIIDTPKTSKGKILPKPVSLAEFMRRIDKAEEEEWEDAVSDVAVEDPRQGGQAAQEEAIAEAGANWILTGVKPEERALPYDPHEDDGLLQTLREFRSRAEKDETEETKAEEEQVEYEYIPKSELEHLINESQKYCKKLSSMLPKKKSCWDRNTH